MFIGINHALKTKETIKVRQFTTLGYDAAVALTHLANSSSPRVSVLLISST